MEYISVIDGKSFASKESLMEHLLENYAFVAEESDFKSIFDKIKKAAPLVEIQSISKDEHGLLNIQLQFFNREKTLLASDSIYIGNSDKSDYCGENIFTNLDKAINWITSFYQKADAIEDLIKTKFNGETFYWVSLHTGGHNRSTIIFGGFTLNDVVYDFQYDFGDTMEILENQLSSLFTNKIEGIVEQYWDHESNYKVLRLNGVDIHTFLRDGTRAVIEITERVN